MTRRLHIAFVNDVAGSHAGGAVSGERVVSALRAHHDVTSIGVGGDLSLEPLRMPFVQDLVRKNSFAFAQPDVERMSGVFEHADVVHVQLPFFLGFKAMALAESLQVPVVAAHHVQPENFLANVGLAAPHLAWLGKRRGLVLLANSLLVHTFYDRAAAVICPSALAERELLQAGLEAPSVVISNGAPDRFAPSSAPHDAVFTVLSVGRLSPEKRHDVILEAVRRSKHGRQLRLVIAGQGPLQEPLRLRAQGSPAQVEIGYLPDDALLRLYQSADLYVHASEVELEGMTVLEAMRCGCPVVVSDAASNAATQFAIDPAHLFPAGDADALAERIDAHFEHREAGAAERSRTLAAVSGYSFGQTIAAYETLYQTVADRRPVASHARQPRKAA